MIDENAYKLGAFERELTVKMMMTDADLRREFKVIDQKMSDLPAQVETVHKNIENLKQSIIK